MKKTIYKIYYVCSIVFSVIFLVLLCVFRLNIVSPEGKRGYEVVTDYTMTTVGAGSTPMGVKQVYSFYLEGIEESYDYLMVYSSHQNIRFFLNDKCIYSMSPNTTVMSGKSPGHVWNQLKLSEEDNGKRVRVEVVPIYEVAIENVPTFYVGNREDITRDVVTNELLVIFLSLIVIVVGIMYIIVIACDYKKADIERHLMMLGSVAFQVGVWKISETKTIMLLFGRYPAISQLPYIMLMGLGITFILCIKELYTTRDKTIWYIPVVAGFINMVVTFVLLALELADMRELLWLTHLVIVMVAAVSLIMTVYEVVKVGWNKRIKRNIIWLLFCVVGVGIDLVLHYVTNSQNNNVFGLLGFVIYISVSGSSAVQEIKRLMEIGIASERYEKMAYHDQLTGLYNRAAFSEHTSSMEFAPEKCIVIVMDLNNLKTCNDKLGHDKGDIYIKETARMIRETFEGIGRCYRMGGDEFNVLLENGDIYVCRQKLQELKEKVAKCDKVGDGFKMGIACGYKMYDRYLDYDIHETARRADKEMYQEKFAMKEL